MWLDIRLPIGIFFFLTGAILTIFGSAESPSRYQQSLGVNLNLWWGMVLIAFGVVMFLLGLRGARKSASEREPNEGENARRG